VGVIGGGWENVGLDENGILKELCAAIDIGRA
jgi:hypothetical protein